MPKLENGQAVYFTATTISGISTYTCYWIENVNVGGGYTVFSLSSTYGSNTGVTTGTTGTATMYVYPMGMPKYSQVHGGKFIIDHLGQVWSDLVLTSGGTGVTSTNSLTYMGNWANNASDGSSPKYADAHGNGIVIYDTIGNPLLSGGPPTIDRWLFVLQDGQVDYVKLLAQSVSQVGSLSWQYGWNPLTGTIDGNPHLKETPGDNIPHRNIITPDGRVNIGDLNYILNFYQNIPLPGSSYVAFDPATSSTYTVSYYKILPPSDNVQSMAFLGSSLIVGGQFNLAYSWDLTSPTYTNVIIFPEDNIHELVTIANNTYAFCGDRGRIYITNGSQASFFKKIPDHISNTVAPIIVWGGATSLRNQLYFGCYAANSSGVLPYYGALWGIDIATGAMRMEQEMSYGGYGGYVSTVSPLIDYSQNSQFYTPQSSQTDGNSLFIGWAETAPYSGISGSFGADITIQAPYTGSQAIIETDLIPIGTFNLPRNFNQIEYRMSTPLQTGESITVYYRKNGISSSYNSQAIFTDNGDGIKFSGSFPTNFQNAQWIQLKIVLNSISSSPSYARLKQIRLLGLVGPTLGTQQIISL